jgi:hypothetical protein
MPSGREPLMYNYPITGRDRSLGLQEVEAPKICSQSAHEWGKVTFFPGRYPWYLFLSEAESTPEAIMRPERLSQLNIPMTTSGSNPRHFGL